MTVGVLNCGLHHSQETVKLIGANSDDDRHKALFRGGSHPLLKGMRLGCYGGGEDG